MRTKKRTVGILVVLAVLTVTTAALAFSRNLSGSWTAPSGKRFVVLHNASTGEAVFTTPASNPNLPVSSIDYKGIVRGENGSTQFNLIATAEDVAVRTDGITCTFLNPTLVVQGQVLGQFPERSLHMKLCIFGWTVRCLDDEGKVVRQKLVSNDCSGTWQ